MLRPMAPPLELRKLIDRYDPGVFAPARPAARVRLTVVGDQAFDVILTRQGARLEPAAGQADATLSADRETWAAVSQDLRSGMAAFGAGRLSVRRDLHLGVGFLAATSGATEQGRLRFRTLDTRRVRISTMEAGQGPP